MLSSGNRTPPRVLALRGLVAALVAIWLIGAPAAKQLGGVRSPYAHQWVMFVGYGLDVCAVDYLRRGPAGDVELDRFETLGLRWFDAPAGVKRVGSVAEATRLGRRLCAKLGPEVDLRMDLRCAARTGWTVEAAREVNLCAARGAAPPPAPAQDAVPTEQSADDADDAVGVHP